MRIYRWLTAGILLCNTHAMCNTILIPTDQATIQQGLDIAQLGDTVMVEPGTYIEFLTWPALDSIKLMSLGDSSNTILEAPVNQRNVFFPSYIGYTTETIFSGFTLTNSMYSSVSLSGGAVLLGVDASPLLEELSFRDYSFVGDGTFSSEMSGLVWVASGSPTIQNCNFNNISITNIYKAYGGAISINSDSNPIISGISITNFSIDASGRIYGGGIHIKDNSHPVIDDIFMSNLFMESDSWNYGYGLYINDDSNPVINNLEIHNVQADSSDWSYGAIYIGNNSSPQLNDIEISNISVDGASRISGAGLHVEENSYPIINNIWIHDLTLHSNNYYSGGAIHMNDECDSAVFDGVLIENLNGICDDDILGANVYIDEADMTIKNIIVKNTTVSAVHYAEGGGMYITGGASPTIENFVFCNNELEGNTGCCINRISGAGITFGDNSNAVFINGLIADNQLIGLSSNCYGAGVYAAISSTPSFINCTITNNTSTDPVAGSGVYAQFTSSVNLTNCIVRNPNSANEIDMDGTSSVTATYSNIRNGFSGAGNIDLNPLYNTTGCYFLSTSSPCFGTGSLSGSPIYDLDKNVRPYPGNSNPSMGAYELGKGKFLGNDTTICGTNSYLIEPSGYEDYDWTPLIVNSTGTYIITATKGCCSIDDTINVTFSPAVPPIDLGADTSFCGGITLDAGSGYDSYLWSNGTSSQSVFLDSSGIYTVTALLGGCSVTDDIVITSQVSPVDLGTYIEACEAFTLDAGAGYDGYLWSDGSLSQTLYIDSSGIYSVIVSAGGCNDTSEVQVSIIDCLHLNGFSGAHFEIFPNPTKGSVVLQFSDYKQLDNFRIFNFLGQETQRIKVKSNVTNVDLKGPKGIYFIQVQKSDNSFETVKVVKN